MSKLAKALTAAAGNAGAGALYVEDVFSTYLYEGNSAARSINNGIDLDGEGGLVWIKARTGGVTANHSLFDTERGIYKWLRSNLTAAELSYSNTVTAFNADGFDLGVNNQQNYSGEDYASWTFRKAEKFFDVVTYTGDGVAGREIAHNLGSTPAVMIVKELGNANYWPVYHISVGATKSLYLDLDQGENTWDGNWNNTAPTSAVFTLGSGTETNRNGGSYVAYLFASDAGGFGDDGDESIIKCGSYTGDGVSGKEIDVGFEPQWVLQKASDTGNPWTIIDAMRGANGQAAQSLQPNSSSAEQTVGQYNPAAIQVTATGFKLMTNDEGGGNGNGNNYIYIAIRRPMKTPESGAEVFQALSYVGTGNVAENRVIDNSGKNGYDSVYFDWRYGGSTSQENIMFTRLSGRALHVNSSNADYPFSQYDASIDSSVGFKTTGNTFNLSGQTRLAHGWRRRPKVHDVVAWKGNGSSSSVDHSLTVSPEIILLWSRENYAGRQVFSSHISNWGKSGDLSGNYAWGNQSNIITNIGEASFTANSWVNANNINYVAMLFSTLDGVSKCGSYYGNNGTQSIDCGFSNGPRYIMIRRTDSGNNEGITTSNWWIWDYVRGINAGSEPALSYNSDSAEISSDAIDPTSSGFTVTQEATNAINTSGGTYIFLAIA